MTEKMIKHYNGSVHIQTALMVTSAIINVDFHAGHEHIRHHLDRRWTIADWCICEDMMLSSARQGARQAPQNLGHW